MIQAGIWKVTYTKLDDVRWGAPIVLFTLKIADSTLAGTEHKESFDKISKREQLLLLPLHEVSF